MTRKIVILHAQSGDWEGLYIDGQLKLEGHSIPLSEAIQHLCPDDVYTSIWDQQDQNLDRFGGQCPDELPDLSEFGEQ